MVNKCIYLLLTSVICLATSCDSYDINMHTTIHEDGTCSREFKISVQKKEKQQADTIAPRTLSFADFHVDGFMHFNHSWKSTWCMKGDTTQHVFPIKNTILPKDTFLITIRQEFASIDKMTTAMPLLYNGRPYQSKGKLEKSFKWFYTEYTFRETFATVSSDYAVPIRKYLDAETASYWFTGQPDILDGKSGNKACEQLKDIENRVDQWIAANLLYDACRLIADHYDSIPNPPLTKKDFLQSRDSLVACAQANMTEMFEQKDFLREIFRQFYHTDVYYEALNENEFSELFGQKYASTMLNNLEYTLTMPGKIIDTGGGRLQDNVAHYKFGPEMFMLKDYTISATSRVNNIWAYVVTVLIILIAIFSYWYKR